MMAKKSVFITRHDFPSIVYELLKERFDVVCWNGTETLSKSKLIENIKGKFGILCYPPNIIDKDVIEAAGHDLKVVSTWSVGLDHLDIKELKSRNIRIGFTPEVLTEAVAEHAITLSLAAGRRILEAQQSISKNEWTSKTWHPLWMCGQGLNRSTVGLIGCGRIGISIIKKAKSFNPSRILYYNRSEKSDANELGAEFKPFDYVIKESDFIIVALSQSAETIGIINKEAINSMKSNAIFVNIGRGGLVDEEALVEALRTKKIGGAGLDVFAKEPLSSDNPFSKLDNVVITPHLASGTYEARITMAEVSAKNIIAVLDDEKMPYEL